MECGTSLRYIQAALGHNSSKAAEIYTRVLAKYNKTIKFHWILYTKVLV
jgi:site-specific recombinase XerD